MESKYCLALCGLALLAAGVTCPAAPQDRVASATTRPASVVGPLCIDGSLDGYRLAWGDEFDGTALDSSKWDYRTDSKHLSTQKATNVSVAEGHLCLKLKKEAAGGKAYTGAGIISKPLFMYGYYETRMKVPSGAGWHTSFWMMKHDGSGGTNPKAACQELDVIENDSVHLKGYGVNVHEWKGAHKQFGGKYITTPDLAEDFHVFGCEFTPLVVNYYLDGKLVKSVDAKAFEHGEQNIWLTSIASSLGNTKAVDDSKLPGTAEYDYVRYFRK